jgi:hypothetical protein
MFGTRNTLSYRKRELGSLINSCYLTVLLKAGGHVVLKKWNKDHGCRGKDLEGSSHGLLRYKVFTTQWQDYVKVVFLLLVPYREFVSLVMTRDRIFMP